MNKSFAVFLLIDPSDYEVIWHRTAILRVTAQRPEVAANEEVDPSGPSKRGAIRSVVMYGLERRAKEKS